MNPHLKHSTRLYILFKSKSILRIARQLGDEVLATNFQLHSIKHELDYALAKYATDAVIANPAPIRSEGESPISPPLIPF